MKVENRGGDVIRLRFFFFFQAEDGIRYLVRSRGLGDVYKRQVQCKATVKVHGVFPSSRGEIASSQTLQLR